MNCNIDIGLDEGGSASQKVDCTEDDDAHFDNGQMASKPSACVSVR